LIDRRELLARARERRLPLAMVEKDYVLGWVLYGLGRIENLVFKGGTALSKVYFPETWRLSEDLDFVSTSSEWLGLLEQMSDALSEVTEKSGIGLAVKSRHANPGYMQLKIQYDAVLGKNWVKVDVTPERPVAKVLSKPLSHQYSDYPRFQVRVECLEEILAQKLRALVERRKSRDYYDVWRMLELEFDQAKVKTLFRQKCAVKGIQFQGLSDFFPVDLRDILRGYWERELGRLVHPVPDMEAVLEELQGALRKLVG